MARLTASGAPTDARAQLGGYESGSWEQLTLALFAADMAYAQGDFDTAVAMWRRYLPVETLISRASSAIDDGSFELAAAVLTNVEEDYLPSNLPGRVRLAAMAASLARFSADAGNFLEADLYWRWAIRLLPDRAQYYFGLGNTLSELKRWPEAVAAYEGAIGIDPAKAAFYFQLAQALVAAGNAEEAVRNLRRGLELESDQAQAQQLLRRLEGY